MGIDIHHVMNVCGHEFKSNIRKRWTLLFMLLFGAITLIISFSGMSAAGYSSYQGLNRTGISLVNLVILFIPLFGMMMGTLSFSGDRGTNALLYSQPIQTSSIIAGKILGLFASLGAAALIGLSLAGAVISINVGTAGLLPFLQFLILILILAAISLSQACFITVYCKRSVRAFAFVLLLWVAQIVLLDLSVLGILTYLNKTSAQLLSYGALVINPVSLTRFLGLTIFGGIHVFGSAGGELIRLVNGSFYFWILGMGILLSWIVIPLILAKALMERQDLA